MKDAVRERYARHATELPSTEVPPSLGVGDPVSLANLRPGETVLDLGSGPGHDLLEAARIVGPSGRAIGVDFTEEMIDRARTSAADAGLENVAILEGDLEHLPVPCGVFDVVISNCVINLVDDKRRALVEAFRALRPGGRLAVLDTAFEQEPPAEVRNDPDAWSCCVGGSLVASDYAAILKDIGYEDVRLDWQEQSCGASCSTGTVEARSIAVTARKPGSAVATLRPAVPADHKAVHALLAEADLPDTVRVEDTIVALDGENVIGCVAVERSGSSTLLRSLVVTPSRRNAGIGRSLMGAALDVARWSGGEDVYIQTKYAQDYFTKYRFAEVPHAELAAALPGTRIWESAAAMRLNFEAADLPLLGKPSKKGLPTFQDGACC